jgi:hypothetical protein
MASRGTGGRGSRRAEATARSASAGGPECMPPAGAFEVALFIWEPWKRTENLGVLRPKGSRFDSPGQRPGTRPNDVPKPQWGATLANDHLKSGRSEVTARWAFFSYVGLIPRPSAWAIESRPFGPQHMPNQNVLASDTNHSATSKAGASPSRLLAHPKFITWNALQAGRSLRGEGSKNLLFSRLSHCSKTYADTKAASGWRGASIGPAQFMSLLSS